MVIPFPACFQVFKPDNSLKALRSLTTTASSTRSKMQLQKLFLAGTLCSQISAQTTTSFSPEELSSASSRALASDVTVLFDFLDDFNRNFQERGEEMASKSLEYPAALQNYAIRIATITNQAQITSALLTNSFPFSDFMTLVPELDWFSSILVEAGASTFYRPEDFLTSASSSSAGGSQVSSTGSAVSSNSSSSTGFLVSSTSSSSSGSTKASTGDSTVPASTESAKSSEPAGTTASSSAESPNHSSLRNNSTSTSVSTTPASNSVNGFNSLYTPLLLTVPLLALLLALI